MCTLGDTADVNPVIEFLRHALQRVSQELGIIEILFTQTIELFYQLCIVSYT
jgi:hypothetical protein